MICFVILIARIMLLPLRLSPFALIALNTCVLTPVNFWLFPLCRCQIWGSRGCHPKSQQELKSPSPTLMTAHQFSRNPNTTSHFCCPHIRMWLYCRSTPRIATNCRRAIAARCAMKSLKTPINKASSQLTVTAALLQPGKH